MDNNESKNIITTRVADKILNRANDIILDLNSVKNTVTKHIVEFREFEVDATQRLINLEGDVATLKDDVAILKDDMKIVKGDISELKTGMNEMKSMLQGIADFIKSK